MRIDRETEHYIGGARPAVHGRVKVGFAKDGRITALDMFVVGENGPYEPAGDTGMTGRMRLAALPAAGDAVARRIGADQHAAAPRAEPAGRHAGHHAHGADPREGGAQARRRSGRDPPDQRAGRQGEVRPGQPARRARLCDERVREGGARPAAPSCSTGTSARRRAASASGIEGARRRRRDRAPSSPARPASTACS